FHYANNYGAVFQSYALYAYLRSIGHEVEVIDYQSDDIINGGSFRCPFSRTAIKADIYTLYIKWRKFRKISTEDHAKTAFEEFRNKFLTISNRRYTSFAGLKSDPPLYDAYVCGSDQIWNPPIHVGVDPAYYLDFAPTGRKRIAYAASFGRNDIEPEYRAEMARLLGKMDALSVREKNGADLVEMLTGREARWMPDPTLLLDDYTAITAPVPESGHLFTYILREKEWVEKANRLVADKLQASIVDPHEKKMSPTEWVGCLKQAKFVVTNSFHGTVFSIIFRKPFVTVGLTGKKAPLNDRMLSLLGRIGLEGRFLAAYDEAALARLVDAPIDWDAAHSRLKEWRAEAHRYLTEALGG
ncbi:MAG TPA: polysaccharide pyruvyl transferase family protein, partial [bacterium]|nr:polysaccharide pyruvyl transferase family protein [bacterium]